MFTLITCLLYLFKGIQMSDTKHFSYDGNIDVVYGVIVKKVQFLVPVKVTAIVNGQEVSIMGQLDYASKEAYFNVPYGNTLKDQVFEYLNNSTALPADMYQATEEIYEEADRAQKEHESINPTGA